MYSINNLLDSGEDRVLYLSDDFENGGLHTKLGKICNDYFHGLVQVYDLDDT